MSATRKLDGLLSYVPVTHLLRAARPLRPFAKPLIGLAVAALVAAGLREAAKRDLIHLPHRDPRIRLDDALALRLRKHLPPGSPRLGVQYSAPVRAYFQDPDVYAELRLTRSKLLDLRKLLGHLAHSDQFFVSDEANRRARGEAWALYELVSAVLGLPVGQSTPPQEPLLA